MSKKDVCLQYPLTWVLLETEGDLETYSYAPDLVGFVLRLCNLVLVTYLLLRSSRYRFGFGHDELLDVDGIK